MRKPLLLVLAIALTVLVCVPITLAQDDNPSADDMGLDDNGGHRANAPSMTTPAPTIPALMTTAATAGSTTTPMALTTIQALPAALRQTLRFPLLLLLPPLLPHLTWRCCQIPGTWHLCGWLCCRPQARACW